MVIDVSLAFMIIQQVNALPLDKRERALRHGRVPVLVGLDAELLARTFGAARAQDVAHVQRVLARFQYREIGTIAPSPTRAATPC